MVLDLSLDRSSPVPLYHQLAVQIEGLIQDGTLQPGDWVETEVELAERLGLGRPTVRQAMHELVRKGLLVRRRGVGTQVVPAQLRRSVELSSLYDDMSAAERRPGTKVLDQRDDVADAEVAAALALSLGDPVLYLRRLRSIDGQPLAVMQNWLPGGLLSAGVRLDSTGLYDVMRQAGVHMHAAHQRIGARAAVRAEAKLLELRAGAPLLTMERTTFDTSGRAVEFARHCYRADLYSFETTLLER